MSTLQALAQQAGSSRVEVVQLDTASAASIQTCVDGLKQTLGHIDVRPGRGLGAGCTAAGEACHVMHTTRSQARWQSNTDGIIAIVLCKRPDWQAACSRAKPAALVVLLQSVHQPIQCAGGGEQRWHQRQPGAL